MDHPEINTQKNENVSGIEVNLTTTSPVVLAQQIGEQNTIFTSDQITGNHLRGLLANAYIRTKGLVRTKAHLDEGFYDLFLSGRVQFGSLTFNNGRPIPLHIHSFKHDKFKDPVSVFTEPEGITKPIKGWGNLNGEVIDTLGYEPVTTFNFHNSRENRAAGRNTDTDKEGGIFYYESLDEGQTFTGKITGAPSLLSQLRAAFAPVFTARLGRSKAVQYGEVSLSLKPLEKSGHAADQVYKAGKYVLTLESPLILLNENGVPSPDKHALTRELHENFTVLNAAASITAIEQFNSIWQSKSGKYAAYKEGSSFLLELKSDLTLPQPITLLGEWKNQGFGKVRLEFFNEDAGYSCAQPSKDICADLTDGADTGVPILDRIREYYLKEQKEIKVKKFAIEAARKWTKKINNHQIGRLERLFECSKSQEQIDSWIKETVDKPAGDALKTAGLVDDNHKFRLERPSVSDFALQRIYWLSFFRTLRKNNKANERKQR